MATKKLSKAQNLAITNIVLGIAQLIIKLYVKKHGELPDKLSEFINEVKVAKAE